MKMPTIRRKATNPMQPLVTDPSGTIRFKPNKIVQYLLDRGPFDMNHLAIQDFSDDDRSQFAQLIGYSRSGFSELSYVGDRIWEKVCELPVHAKRREATDAV